MKGAARTTRRAQIFSGEFIISFLVFITAFSLLIGLWGTSTRDIFAAESSRTMEDLGTDAAEALVRTPGVPENWTATDVTSLGLANGSRTLSERKVKEFMLYMNDSDDSLCPVAGATNYDCNLYMLGIGGYDAYFNLSYLDGSTAVVNGTKAYAGRKPQNQTDEVTIMRTVILNDEIARLYVTVWRNRTEG